MNNSRNETAAQAATRSGGDHDDELGLCKALSVNRTLKPVARPIYRDGVFCGNDVGWAWVTLGAGGGQVLVRLADGRRA